MEKFSRNNVSKVYCQRCDLVFDSREKYQRHLERHSQSISCEVCPIDTVITKFVNMFRR